MAGVNVETVAKALNVTPRRVQQLAAEGMPRATRGEYDLGQCMAWYIRFLQKALESRQAPGGDAASQEFTRERSRLAREQADRTALQNAELRGDLGRLSVWQEELERFMAEMRAAILSLPSKLAPQLDGDAAARQRTLEAAVHEVLGRLATYRPSRRTSRSPAGDPARGVDSPAASAADGQSVGRSASAAKQRGRGRAGPVAH